MQKLQLIGGMLLVGSAFACAPLPLQEEGTALTSAREAGRQELASKCNWTQEFCQLDLSVQGLPFRVYSEAGKIQMQRFDAETGDWKHETERDSGMDYRLLQAASLRGNIYLTECDSSGNKKIQRYQPESQRWQQLRYESLGCTL